MPTGRLPGDKYDPQKMKPVLIVLGLGIAGMVLWTYLTAAAFGFLRFVALFGMFMGGILLLAKLIHHLVGMKCPDCRQPLFHTDDQGIFPGATGPDDVWLNSIGIHILKCKRCGKEYHKLYYPPEFAANAGRYLMHDANHIMKIYSGGSDLIKDTPVLPKAKPKMTLHEYEALKRRVKQEVDRRNRREGFEVRE